ncbi:MAG TPA: hypothetical protein P5279_05765 [Anaerohalosphaeraceae bacterium]|mgnify:CR=1 FL=1|jgi:hypothetical protein|nr:hypothetical protein [Anaerohalosphaeraceae bacterium]HRT49979.1 hypothetical protein [Anaerohalosphaeraceae bacterium]HRT85723.1 hypothetical protein [Anaerohalosphaeraceae bacterium]
MITTLKITTIFAAVVCISLVGFVGAFGLRGDPEIEELINGPRVIQELKKLMPAAPSTEGQVSPLVKEAQRFALRIDPPPPAPPAPKTTSVTPKPPTARAVDNPPPPPPPPPPPSRFDLIATCRYEHDPAKSIALLDLPGKGLKWFRVGENIEHLVLAEVMDGSISVTQSGRPPQTIEMKKEQPFARNLLLQEGQKLEIPASGELKYERVGLPTTPSALTRGNAYFAPDRAAQTTSAAATTASAGASSIRKPATTPVTRQPRTYTPPTRPRTLPPEQTAEQRKATLDDNIASLKSIMAEPNPNASKDEIAEEQAALAKLLELLEEERKQTVQQSKVTTADNPRKE